MDMGFQNRFGCHVFNDAVMKRMLSPSIYKSLQETRKEGRTLDAGIAQPVADAMLQWAIEQGATHYLHWFQPIDRKSTRLNSSH